MPKLEVFFDYACPYCLKGHRNLMELLPEFPGLEIEWCPCESHPRPEMHGAHSDLCIRGMFFARDHGVDLLAYHDRMYDAALGKRVNIERIDEVVAVVADLLDMEALRTALEQGEYVDTLNRANDYAYETSGVWAVPSYRMGGKKLDAIEGIGVPKEKLAAFLK